MIENFNNVESNNQTSKEKDLLELTRETTKDLHSFSQEIAKQANPDIPPSNSANPDSTDPDVVDANPDTKEKKVNLTTWLNAIETAVDHRWDARIRKLTNVWLEYKFSKKEALQLWYSGLNEFTWNLSSYFGKHVPNIWLKWVPNLKAIGIIKTNKDGIFDDKYGLRYLVSDKTGVDYWRIDVAWGKSWASLTFFLWKDIGKKWTNVELLTDIQYDAENKKVLAPYTELQLNQQLTNQFKVFMRAEISWTKFREWNYMVWGAVNF